jgi:hypothetical protein
MTQPASESPRRTPFRISDALVVAGVPLLGYLYAFCYQYGYLSHFGIPYWFVQVGVPQAATLALLAVAIFVVLYSLLGLLPTGPYGGFILVLFRLGRATFPAMTVVALILLADWRSPINVFVTVAGSLFLSYATVGLVADWVLAPLVRYRGSFLERWDEELKKEIGKPTTDAAASLMDRAISSGRLAGHHPLLSWVLLFVFPVLAFAAGVASAHLRHTWLVRSEKPPCVVIAQYQSGLLCVGLTGDRRATWPRFEVIPSNARTQLENRLLGPLASYGARPRW